MGGTGSKLTYSPSGFTVLLMVGLQGTGKTTTCGKLADLPQAERQEAHALRVRHLQACGHRSARSRGQSRSRRTPVYVQTETAASRRKRSRWRPATGGREERLETCSSSIPPDDCRSIEALMEELAESQKGRKASRNTARSGRPHRPGRGQRRRGLQRETGRRRNRNDQDGRRFQRRSSSFGQESDG